jgi:hypothetical protein
MRTREHQTHDREGRKPTGGGFRPTTRDIVAEVGSFAHLTRGRENVPAKRRVIPTYIP